MVRWVCQFFTPELDLSTLRGCQWQPRTPVWQESTPESREKRVELLFTCVQLLPNLKIRSLTFPFLGTSRERVQEGGQLMSFPMITWRLVECHHLTVLSSSEAIFYNGLVCNYKITLQSQIRLWIWVALDLSVLLSTQLQWRPFNKVVNLLIGDVSQVGLQLLPLVLSFSLKHFWWFKIFNLCGPLAQRFQPGLEILRVRRFRSSRSRDSEP